MAADPFESLLEGLHPLEVQVLQVLTTGEPLWDEEILARTGLEESQFQTAGEWLRHKGLLQTVEELSEHKVSLTELGRRYHTTRLPELRILEWLATGEPLTRAALTGEKGLDPTEASSAIGALKEAQAITILPGGLLSACSASGGEPEEVRRTIGAITRTQELLETVANMGTRPLEEFSPDDQECIRRAAQRLRRAKGKGLFRVAERTSHRSRLTDLGQRAVAALGGRRPSEVSQLTPAMLQDGSWRQKTFRAYTIALRPPRQAGGRKHPYRVFLESVEAKLVALGFQEMRGPLVESEFWNMDALFMPQFHSARDIHDVYYLNTSRSAEDLDEPLLARVAKTHRDGWKTGSRGWGYAFDPARSRRFLLRSQGTALSARTLASQPQIPGKYFAIARCFRYEQVDVTHATDFFQIEGIVLGREITFRTLLGLLELLAREIAHADDVRFLPAYFPFTEPSVELHVQHPSLGWIELGGAGMFRPEVTLPLGVRVPVIAWGLGLDRMAMIALGLHDIRDLFTSDLELIRALRSPLPGDRLTSQTSPP